MSEIKVGTLWVGKNSFRTEVEVLDTCIVNGVLRKMVNGNKFLHPAWTSHKDFLNDYEPKVVSSEGERLANLIEAAKSVRDSLQKYDQDKHASGEIFYCEMMSKSVGLLSEAVNNYEAGER